MLTLLKWWNTSLNNHESWPNMTSPTHQMISQDSISICCVYLLREQASLPSKLRYFSSIQHSARHKLSKYSISFSLSHFPPPPPCVCTMWCDIETYSSPVHMLATPVPPDILDYPTSTDMVVREGSNVTLKCAARGSPQPNIIWRREGGEPIALTGQREGSTKLKMKMQFYLSALLSVLCCCYYF